VANARTKPMMLVDCRSYAGNTAKGYAIES